MDLIIQEYLLYMVYKSNTKYIDCICKVECEGRWQHQGQICARELVVVVVVLLVSLLALLEALMHVIVMPKSPTTR
jgi:hypothetical protein